MQNFLPPSVSVIVPVHNAGKYLKKRIESLLDQTLKNIEFIFVLDCPTDGSGKFIETYVRNDPRVKIVIHENNLHIGISRNDGLEIASGEYIAFADHDDYCALDMYERLYACAKENDADIVFSDMYLEKSGKLIEKEYFKETAEAHVREKILEQLLKGNGFYYSVLNHLYKRSLLEEYSIRFVDTRQISLEDRFFNLLAYQNTQRIVHLSNKLIYHILYPGSTQHSYAFKSLMPTMNHLEQMCSFFQMNPEFQIVYQQEFCVEVVKNLYYSFLPEIRYKSLFYGLRILKQIKDRPGIQECLDNFSRLSAKSRLPWRLRFFYQFLKFYRVKRLG